MNNKAEMLLNLINNGRVCVLGMGISNLPLIDRLLSRGARVEARDAKELSALPAAIGEYIKRGLAVKCGADYLSDINADIIFRSPGLRPDLSEIAAAVAAGAVLTSEMELFFALTPTKIYAITGSDGKTTTTTLTGLILARVTAPAGRVYVGGNIGEPLLPRLPEMTESDSAVVELSSFQLQTMTDSPDVAVITNISPNHLNWHTGMDEYIAAKGNIFSSPRTKTLVVNFASPDARKLSEKANCDVVYFSSHAEDVAALSSRPPSVYERDGVIIYNGRGGEERMLAVSDIKLPGRHNVENYMAAIAATHGVATPEIYREIATTFGGVEHRLEFVRRLSGVDYYNGSIDSSPSRTAAALSAFADSDSVVICGGSDKHISFAPLAEVLCDRARAVVLTGQTRDLIREAILALPETRRARLRVLYEPEFAAAVAAARDAADGHGRVLLSPACASFDAFKNFEERGNCFKKIVNSFKE